MERRDSAVSRPWQAEWYQPDNPPQPLPAGTGIVEVFDKLEIKRQLLILGEPGSGKTTTMLELAQDLLERANGDKNQPIPVLVSLSSWKKPEVGILEWLVAELKSKYGLRQDLGKAWIERRILLPLLDGLDEVAPGLQQKCAEAINAWLTGELENQPCGVLVCCRREEFEKIVQKPLSLQGAIYLQALTRVQIEEYFAQFELQGVWQTVRDDTALQDLLMKPLFLSMFGLVQIQGKFDLATWQARATSEEKIEYLFDTYWNGVMSRELILNPQQKNSGWLSQTYKTKPLPKRKAVRRILVFVAKAMERDPSIGTELLIEKIQPSWLPKKKQKIILRLIGGTISGLIGGTISGLTWGVFWGLTTSLCFGIVSGLTWCKLDIETVEIISIPMLFRSKKEFIKTLHKAKTLHLVPVLGLGMGLILSSGPGALSLIVGLMVGVIWSLSLGIIRYITVGLNVDIQTRIHPNQGIKNSIKNMVVLGTIIAIFSFPVGCFLKHLLTKYQVDCNQIHVIVFVFLSSLMYFGFMSGGGYPFIEHITLRIVLAWNRYVPFRFDLLLDYCTERLLMQRIGGRYRFMHKLLQDHFAKMKLD